uniref:Uncharacterized protein n=1 Tax=viral metagenome TaxID=1070528 RepID=A0A6C0LG04_9ZZZZ
MTSSLLKNASSAFISKAMMSAFLFFLINPIGSLLIASISKFILLYNNIIINISLFKIKGYKII